MLHAVGTGGLGSLVAGAQVAAGGPGGVPAEDASEAQRVTPRGHVLSLHARASQHGYRGESKQYSYKSTRPRETVAQGGASLQPERF